MTSRNVPLAVSLAMLFAVGGAPMISAEEPVIGGACEGCELVFVGMPESLTPHARIAPAHEIGEPLRIEGVVKDPNGRPAAGIVIYAYHTDASGVYPRASTRHGRLRGWTRTDSEGFYRFDTIRPGAYPGRSIPQHVHMHVIEPGRGTYWIASIEFSDDPLLTDRHRSEADDGRGGSGLVDPTREEGGRWRVRRDVVLGLNVPGYPTDK